jgi:catechol 2,3-dioxygenase-like lactoylglutathione lyase family enzyme
VSAEGRQVLTNCELVAFVATKDAPKARHFYKEILGLPLVSDEPWALVFDAHGTTLRVQKVDAFEPLPFTSLGWEVRDIDEAVTALANQGVRFERFPGMDQDATGVWASPSGARVDWFKDPDGNTLSVTQPASSRGSQ